jgi:AcrR family transcriptional regulator
MRLRDEKKERLVKHKAIDLISGQGLNGFSMQKLARAARVSPATLYIYYKNKEDLLLKLGAEEGIRMTRATMEGFDPNMSFREGLKKQWENRAKFILSNPKENKVLEQLKLSSYGERIFSAITDEFAEVMSRFTRTAVKNGELISLPVEVYWTIAFAPLYNLLRFHFNGRGVGLRPFRFSDKIMYQTLEIVLKALRPDKEYKSTLKKSKSARN